MTTIHRRNFENVTGLTPHEYHKAYSFPPDAKCCGCKGKPAVRAVVFCPLDEAVRRNMLVGMTAAALQSITLPMYDGNTKKMYVRISLAYACERCTPAMERALAKGPSWCIVDIHRGPNPTNRKSLGRMGSHFDALPPETTKLFDNAGRELVVAPRDAESAATSEGPKVEN